jgi:hypothetical protein
MSRSSTGEMNVLNEVKPFKKSKEIFSVRVDNPTIGDQKFQNKSEKKENFKILSWDSEKIILKRLKRGRKKRGHYKVKYIFNEFF